MVSKDLGVAPGAAARFGCSVMWPLLGCLRSQAPRICRKVLRQDPPRPISLRPARVSGTHAQKPWGSLRLGLDCSAPRTIPTWCGSRGSPFQRAVFAPRPLGQRRIVGPARSPGMGPVSRARQSLLVASATHRFRSWWPLFMGRPPLGVDEANSVRQDDSVAHLLTIENAGRASASSGIEDPGPYQGSIGSDLKESAEGTPCLRHFLDSEDQRLRTLCWPGSPPIACAVKSTSRWATTMSRAGRWWVNQHLGGHWPRRASTMFGVQAVGKVQDVRFTPATCRLGAAADAVYVNDLDLPPIKIGSELFDPEAAAGPCDLGPQSSAPQRSKAPSTTSGMAYGLVVDQKIQASANGSPMTPMTFSIILSADWIESVVIAGAFKGGGPKKKSAGKSLVRKQALLAKLRETRCETESLVELGNSAMLRSLFKKFFCPTRASWRPDLCAKIPICQV